MNAKDLVDVSVVSETHTVSRKTIANNVEWLLPFGDGGYASSTLDGRNSRRYHGLFVAGPDGANDGRRVLLSRLDESLIVEGERIEFYYREFQDAHHGRVCSSLQKFSCFLPIESDLEGAPQDRIRTLTWDYSFELSDGRKGLFRKKLCRSSVGFGLSFCYEIVGEFSSAQLILEAFCSFRSYHSLRGEVTPPPFHVHLEDFCTLKVQDQEYEIRVGGRGGSWQSSLVPYYSFYYDEEEARGFDSLEHYWKVGEWRSNESEMSWEIQVLGSSEPDAFLQDDVNSTQRSSSEAVSDENNKSKHSLLPLLLSISKDFLVLNAKREPDIIAGYHWFTCWARDTMISLPGLCGVTGRYEIYRSILMRWSSFMSQGVLPNRVGVLNPLYNTVDGTLWFVHALYDYYQRTGDIESFERYFMEKLREIFVWHNRGTHYGIKVDSRDGMIQAGERYTNLTWMDARVNDIPVTPRPGKAVEIQALWYSALHIMKFFSEETGDSHMSRELSLLSGKLEESFLPRFWSDARGFLADVSLPDGENDCSIRPNAIFALSLPFPLITEENLAHQILHVFEEKLYTPFGLRTLSPDDENYAERYEGNGRERDSAYHQGTVWPWLLGPYVDALKRFEPEKAREIQDATNDTFLQELTRGAVGNLSEIYDASSRASPRGCIAQAWSVAELIRVLA